jgi:hypothetical protein
MLQSNTPTITSHTFNHSHTDRSVSLSQYSIFFCWLSSINFPLQNLIRNSFIVIFIYHFQHLPTFFSFSWNCVCKFVSIFSVIPSFLFWTYYCVLYCCQGKCSAFLCVIFCLSVHLWSVWKKRLCYCRLDFIILKRIIWKFLMPWYGMSWLAHL